MNMASTCLSKNYFQLIKILIISTYLYIKSFQLLSRFRNRICCSLWPWTCIFWGDSLHWGNSFRVLLKSAQVTFLSRLNVTLFLFHAVYASSFELSMMLVRWAQLQHPSYDISVNGMSIRIYLDVISVLDLYSLLTLYQWEVYWSELEQHKKSNLRL